MKIVIIGGTGTIGAAVASALEPRHQVTRVSRTGSIKADMNYSTRCSNQSAALTPLSRVRAAYRLRLSYRSPMQPDAGTPVSVVAETYVKAMRVP
jgi:hypothetical protein